MAIGEDPADLLGGPGQDRDHGDLAVGGQAVTLIGAQLVRVVDHALAGHDLAQRPDDLGAARQDPLFGFGHAHGGRLPGCRPGYAADLSNW